jgi:hypothetical protein
VNPEAKAFDADKGESIRIEAQLPALFALVSVDPRPMLSFFRIKEG